MKEQKIPYLMRLAVASAEGDRAKFGKIMLEGIQEITEEILDVANEHAAKDLPLVTAVLFITAQTLSSTLSDEGRRIAEGIVNRTESIAIDLAELNRQMNHEEHGENQD